MENIKKETTSEYKIGHTTYIVKTVFNPDFHQSLSDILKRLIIHESENIISEKRQEREMQVI